MRVQGVRMGQDDQMKSVKWRKYKRYKMTCMKWLIPPDDIHEENIKCKILHLFGKKFKQKRFIINCPLQMILRHFILIGNNNTYFTWKFIYFNL